MPNWIVIDETAVRTSAISVFLDAMKAIAASKSEANPLPTIITAVVSRIRSAVSAGNALDADTTKIPKSLEDLALGMILRRVKNYVQRPLTQAETDQAREDREYLKQITETPLKFETPDMPAGDAEMQSPGGLIDQAQAGNSGNSREELGNL